MPIATLRSMSVQAQHRSKTVLSGGDRASLKAFPDVAIDVKDLLKASK